ncbi:unnamed protein product [Diatraea saccharalis]|uniref:Uncharacterized protein n=1 Tax=Diatraea saccharalis TaxID=40085 RepID=A0A9N9WH25_9NEOP|nr:unnamed protein product [Diatraea saccharalis]
MMPSVHQAGVSPLLLKASEVMTSDSRTETKECMKTTQVLSNATVVISGPTTHNKEEVKEFHIGVRDIQKNTSARWIYFHTCPRGEEVDDDLFHHCNSRTFSSFQNMQYISAALMANAVKGYKF